MNKDVIYIDVDDDVTAIIGKIKSAKEKIVALVPPKRAGALQSAVNLRLLERMAKSDKKQLVLITNNQALIGLAANAQIPVAKNLQSKPELAEIPAIVVDDGDDIIDGSELPVGDHAKTVKVKDGTKPVAQDTRTDAIDATDLDIDGEAVAAAPVAARVATAAKKTKGRSKIPNFDSFRKKLFFGIAGALVLTGLLIWMYVFAPAATIIITASTTPQPVSAAVKLGGSAATDFKSGVVSSVTQQEQKDETVQFTPTGQKDMGQAATGTVRFSTSSFAGLGTIPAGTKLKTSSGLVFTTDNSVTLSYQGGSSASGTTTITAAASGTNYNGASGAMSGAPSNVSANLVGTTSGGTSNIVTVVTADDIDRAQGQLIGQSTDDEKAALTKKFSGDDIVVDGSFVVNRGTATSSPAVDQQVQNGAQATLTVPTTYTIEAVAKSELDSYLKASLTSKIDANSQKIYDTGIDKATLSNFQKADDGTMTATVNATGSVGPVINENDIKNQVKGKRYGEVQQSLESMNGIKSVDVQFSYFWVRTVPNNTNKISIEFKVDNE